MSRSCELIPPELESEAARAGRAEGASPSSDRLPCPDAVGLRGRRVARRKATLSSHSPFRSSTPISKSQRRNEAVEYVYVTGRVFLISHL